MRLPRDFHIETSPTSGAVRFFTPQGQPGRWSTPVYRSNGKLDRHYLILRLRELARELDRWKHPNRQPRGITYQFIEPTKGEFKFNRPQLGGHITRSDFEVATTRATEIEFNDISKKVAADVNSAFTLAKNLDQFNIVLAEGIEITVHLDKDNQGYQI